MFWTLINECITEQSAWLYHKFDNARGSDYARIGSMELDAEETWEEPARGIDYARFGSVEQVGIAGMGGGGGASSGVHDC